MGNVHRLASVQSDAGAVQRSAAERVFDHWVWMLGKKRGLTAFGPTRRRVVEKALALYDEDVLLMAVEGCAASPWHAGDNDRGRAYQDLELILRDEAHIERFAAEGLALRERAERVARRDAEVCGAATEDPALAEAARERVRALAQRMRGGRV